jgi:molybdopterin converting factor small subunit
MTITINGDNINYTLEEEKTAGDIFNGLSSWLENSGMLIGRLEINSEYRPLDNQDWKSILIENIEDLSIEALSFRAGRMRQLETARDYFTLLETAVRNDDRESLKELQDGFNDLKKILPHLLEEGPHPTILPHLDETLGRGFSHPDEATAMEAVRMAAILENRWKEAADPETEALSAATALAEMADNLDHVAVQLQTGQDKTAMETIIRLAELLQTFMRALGWSEGGSEIERITNNMNEILSELEEALKAGDTVLIGDLLEYEIKPRLIELPSGLNFSGEIL